MDNIPALRGRMGDWEYYVAIMKLADVAQRVRFAEEVHSHEALDDLIQREIGKRTSNMVEYLLKQPQRFYGSIIVAVYGGNPRFEPVRMAEHRLLDNTGSAFGLIVFDGSQQYFALDGQHRLASIKKAVKADPSLGTEEISVVFVAHNQSHEGLARTRRLFTTLNRYAVKTATHTEIALDEDDGVAIVTRQLVREHPLFEGERVKIKGKSVSVREEDVLTTLATLYEMNQNLLMTKTRDVKSKRFQQFKPDDATLDEMVNELETIWNGVATVFSVFRSVVERRATPGFLRKGGDEEGSGSLLMRPVGQLALSRALRVSLDEGMDLENILKLLDRIDWRLGEPPWKGTVWHGGRMVTTKEMQRLCFRLICYMIGCANKSELRDLRDAYRQQLEDNEAELPPTVKVE